MEFLISILPVLVIILVIISLILLFNIIKSKEMDVKNKIKWILVVLFIPVLGSFFYLVKILK